MAGLADLVTIAMMRHKGFPESADYDMPGFTKAWLEMDPRATSTPDPHDQGRVHFTDPWKLPSHPSFSNQSIYADDSAPEWKTYDVNPESNSFDYWRTPPEKRKEYWRLEKPNGEIVAWDAPWAQGSSSERKRAIKDFSDYGVYDMNKEGLSAMLQMMSEAK